MATWLTLVNAVQARLRETQTASVTSNAYSTLIGSLVNQAKREIEDMHDWTALRTFLSFNTSSGTATYTITSSTDRSRFYTKEQEIYDDTNDSILYPAPDQFIDNLTYIGTTQSAPPSYYRIRGVSSGVLQLTLYPTPNGTYTMRVPMTVPQADLAADATVLTIPADPVIERAYALALMERGEDGGTMSIQAAANANLAIAQAVERDKANMHISESTWEVY